MAQCVFLTTRTEKGCPRGTIHRRYCGPQRPHFYCSTTKSGDIFKTTREELLKYIGQMFKEGHLVRRSPEERQRANISIFMVTASIPTTFRTKVENKVAHLYSKMLEALGSRLGRAFATYWGQCMAFLPSKIEAELTFENIYATSDTFELVALIQMQCQKFKGNQDKYHALINAKARFFKTYQH